MDDRESAVRSRRPNDHGEPGQQSPGLGGSLAGVTVLAFEQAVAGPLATRHLADLGATVLKVERPDGGDFARHYDTFVDGQSSYFVWLNREKQSIALDLSQPADLARARALIAGADVVLQNLAPGALARRGLDLDQLCREREDLIAVTISGYGGAGPSAERKAYDLLLQAEAGLIEITGDGGMRAKVGISVVDIATGMYAFSAVLAALWRREKTGLGTHVQVAMLDVIAEWMMQPIYQELATGRPPARTGARHASIAPYGPVATCDGQIFIAVQNEREWARLCAHVLGDASLASDPRFASNPARVKHADELGELIARGVGSLTTAQARQRLDDAGIAYGMLRHPAELLDDPQLRARGRWAQVSTPGGWAPALRPVLLPDSDCTALGAVPALGDHDPAGQPLRRPGSADREGGRR